MKTAKYTLKAVKAYQNKFDLQQLRLDKGLKARAAAVGLTPSGMADIIRQEVERRENTDFENA